MTRLQNRLVELGYANGTPNGRYAAATVSAVKLFQRAAGLEETGIATAALQALLYSEDAPAYTAAPRGVTGDRYYPYNLSMTVLREGSSGELVVYLQTRLAELGYFSGEADGQYGPATADAVRAVQANMGLAQTGEASISFQEHVYSEATPPADVPMYEETQSFATLQMGDSDPGGCYHGPCGEPATAIVGTWLSRPRSRARHRGRVWRSDAQRRDGGTARHGLREGRWHRHARIPGLPLLPLLRHDPEIAFPGARIRQSMEDSRPRFDAPGAVVYNKSA